MTPTRSICQYGQTVSWGVGTSCSQLRSGNKRVLTDCSVHVTRGIESFSAFSEEFELSPTCLFQYFQLGHALRAQEKSSLLVYAPLIMFTRVVETSSSKKGPPDHVHTSGRDL